MKKLFASVLTMIMAMCMSVSVMAESSGVTVKCTITDEPVTFEYESGKDGEASAIINSLIDISELETQNRVIRAITVSNDSADGSAVDFVLRLSLANADDDAAPTEEESRLLDYYEVTVSDSKGNVLYEDKAAQTDAGAAYRDIPLDALSSESKLFNIEISVNDDFDDTDFAETTEKLDWSIVSVVSTKTEAKEGLSEDKHGVITVEAGEYVCGDDFEEGKYTITGSGKLTIYNTSGEEKTTVALKLADDEASNGVSEYLVNLSDGEKIAVDSVMKLSPYVASKAVSNTDADTADKATASQTSSSKTNPKTGDTLPSAMLGIAAAAMILAVCIEMKKKNN